MNDQENTESVESSPVLEKGKEIRAAIDKAYQTLTDFEARISPVLQIETIQELVPEEVKDITSTAAQLAQELAAIATSLSELVKGFDELVQQT